MSEHGRVTELSEQMLPNLIRTDDDIKRASKLWCEDRATAEAMYGHISLWVTSSVTNMQGLFWKANDFNEDLSDWDVSNVTNMKELFSHARSYEGGDLNRWDVSNVKTMDLLFAQCNKFDGNISNWETGNCTSMLFMFCGAWSFTGDLSGWRVSIGCDTREVFISCHVKFEPVWRQHQGDPIWESHEKQKREEGREQNREQRRELLRQRKRDANWERRRAWMIVIAPYIRRARKVSQSPLQMMFDVFGLYQHITIFL